MNPADLYHVGLVVDDIDAAAARLTAAAGYHWTAPLAYTISVTTEGGDIDVPLRFVYSIEAPHLELIEQVPGTLWTAAPGQPAHHLGYWVDDLGAAAADLQRAGYRLEARPSGPALSTFAYLRDPSGLRVELVDRALFPDWPGFLQQMRTP